MLANDGWHLRELIVPRWSPPDLALRSSALAPFLAMYVVEVHDIVDRQLEAMSTQFRPFIPRGFRRPMSTLG